MPPLAPPPAPHMMPQPTPGQGAMPSSPASAMPQPPIGGGAMPPPGGGMAPPAGGQSITPLPPDQVYGINLIVAEVLWRRIGILGQDEVNRLADAITPENAHVFMRLFPELSQAIQSALKDDTGGEEEMGGEGAEEEPMPGDYAGPPGTSPPVRPQGGGLSQF